MGTATLEVVSQAFLAKDVWGLWICENNRATEDQFQVDGAWLYLYERRGSNLPHLSVSSSGLSRLPLSSLSFHMTP